MTFVFFAFQVGENYKTGGYVITPNTMELLKKHVEAVKGKVNFSYVSIISLDLSDSLLYCILCALVVLFH